jgi:hypothetical protein
MPVWAVDITLSAVFVELLCCVQLLHSTAMNKHTERMATEIGAKLRG